ncbi:DMT family transporter [Burkholderia contaminans]|uniref:DMT family transporter n=1 Tax=Burkholderia contaminans TaxID=488447 RepID=UPI00158A19EF|nr:DMT family transporter [Burkholderia contaminans]
MPLLLLLVVSFLWGSSFILLKAAATAFDPLCVAMLRAVIATVSMVVWCVLTGARWPRSTSLWRSIFGLSLIGQVLPFVALSWASTYLTAGHVAMFVGAAPLMTFVIARVVGIERGLSLIQAIGLLIGLLGLWVAIGRVSPEDGSPGLAGNVLALLAALGYATGALISRRVTAAIGSVMAVTTALIVTTGFLAAVFAFARFFYVPTPVSTINVEAVVAVLLLGSANTAIAYVIYFSLIKRAGALFASLNNYLVPPLGMLLGVAFLGERWSLTSACSIALTILGATMVAYGRPAGVGEKVQVRLGPNGSGVEG